MAFTCPRCQRTSHSPEDERQGYCGACHDSTGRGTVHASAEPTGDWQCPECGLRLLVPPDCSLLMCPPCYAATGRLVLMARAWRCEVPGVSAQEVADGFEHVRDLMGAGMVSLADLRQADALSSGDTLSFTVPGALITGDQGGISVDRQVEVDDYPWSDSMQWHSGDAEW